uniref:Uncharacterized protein n=1 Tax=viral metagenome TaxID=1070528 RepID=A0A6H1Z992_9ZZZZ
MRKLAILSVVILTMIVVGCSTMGFKSYSEMTAYDKGLFFLKQYNTQLRGLFNQMVDPVVSVTARNQMYSDLMEGRIGAAQIPINPNLSDTQKQTINQKRAILIKMEPYVDMYINIVLGGGIPSAENEQAILDFIDQLTNLALGV